MTISLRPIAFDEIPTVVGIELDDSDESRAGGSLTMVFDRLKLRSDRQLHLPFLIIAELDVVGFLMLREGAASPPWAHSGAITLHNFRISRQAQGKGYGTAALVLAARWIVEHRCESAKMMLSVNSENLKAVRFYLRCGFGHSGLSFEGRLGTEIVLSARASQIVKRHVTGDRPDATT